MGQSMTVAAKQVGEFCIFTTDRVLTGQDGVRFESAPAADSEDGFPAVLAERLFANDSAIESVWVAASEVVIGRSGGWDDDTRETAERTITNLYRFYS
jgi:hypothetical protein